MLKASLCIAAAIVALAASTFRSRAGEPPSVAERNEKIPAFGGKKNEDRLRKVIHDTVVPQRRKPVKNPQADAQLRWSEPVGGMIARIEYAGETYAGFVVLLVLKNVSDKPLAVPTVNPRGGGKDAPFQLYAQQVDGTWQQTIWRSQSPSQEEPRQVSLGMVTLKPGESCLAYFGGIEDYSAPRTSLRYAAKLKAALKLPVAFQQGDWNGELETTMRPTRIRDVGSHTLSESLPCPDYLPELSSRRAELGNGSGDEPDVKLLYLSNAAILNVLQRYEPSGVRREFEKRMLAEHDLPMKLLLAAVASSAGSERAALFLMESMKSPKYNVFTNVHEALQVVLRSQQSDPPDWIVELIQTALIDDRYADVRNSRGQSSDGTPIRISYFADEFSDLTLALGYAKSRKAVPFLIEMVKRTKGKRMPVMALGMTGDPRAIPVLIECVQRAGKTAKYTEGAGLRDEFEWPVSALAQQKSKEAVPVLLEYIEFPDVIEALEMIGDPKALPAIREIVASEGRLIKNGKALTPFLDEDRWFAARVAEASLTGDAVPRLCEMLGDMSLDHFQRRTVVWRLGDRRDPRAIDALIRAIKNDPEGSVVNQSITVLAAFKYKSTVEGLIECFDADFEGKADWKRAHQPAMFQANIAESLHEITDQPIGPDKKQWERWWRENGPESGLK